MTQDEIKALGQKATTEVWNEFKQAWENDPQLKKASYEIMTIGWNLFKDRIPEIDSIEFWQDPVRHLKTLDIVRRQCEAYTEIYKKLWDEVYRQKYGKKPQ